MNNRYFNSLIIIIYMIGMLGQAVASELDTLAPSSGLDGISSLKTRSIENTVSEGNNYTDTMSYVRFQEFIPFDRSNAESNLIILAQLGNERAKEYLLKQYEKLCVKLAYIKYREYKKSSYYNRAIEVQDFITFAQIGFLKAIQGFNPNYGASLMSYAWPAVMNTINRELLQALGIPNSMALNVRKVVYGRAMFKEKNGYFPSNKDLAEFLNNGFTEKKVAHLFDIYASNPVSLNEPISKNDSSSSARESFIENKNSHISPVKNFDEIEMKRNIHKALRFLNKKEQLIIEGRFLKEEKTLGELGIELNVSGERIRQLEGATLRLLKTILDFIAGITESEFQAIGNIITDAVSDSDLLVQEIIYQTYIEKKTNAEIVRLLHLKNGIELTEIRKSFLKKLEKRLKTQIADIPVFSDSKIAGKISLERFLKVFLEPSITDPLVALTSYAKDELKVKINEQDLMEYLKHYHRFMNDLDMRLITLRYIEDMSLNKVAKRLNQDIHVLTNRLAHLKIQVNSVIEVEQKISDSVAKPLKKMILNFINEMPLRNRNIFIDLFYNNMTLHALAEKHAVQRSTVSRMKKRVLKKLQEKTLEILKSFDVQDLDKITYIEAISFIKDRFEHFLDGFIYKIEKSEFSLEQVVNTIDEVIFQYIQNNVQTKLLESSLKDISKDLVFYIDPVFIKERNYQIFKLFYIENLTSDQIAEQMNLTKDQVEGSLSERRKVFKGVIKMYESLLMKEAIEARILLARTINEMEVRLKEFFVYYAYDNLNYVEIDRLRGFSLTKRSGEIKFQKMLRKLQKQMLLKTESEKIHKVFGGRVFNLKFFLKSLKQSFARSHFNIPEVIISDTAINIVGDTKPQLNLDSINESYPNSVLTDKFPPRLLRRIADKSAYVKGISDDKNYLELASIIDTFDEKQLMILNLISDNKFTNKNTIAYLNMKLSKAKQRFKVIKNKINKYRDLLKNYSRQERWQIRKVLVREMLKLPLNYRAALIYRYYDNLSVNYIAKSLGYKASSNSTLNNAIVMLEKSFLEEIKSEEIKELIKKSRDNLRLLLITMRADFKRDIFNVASIKPEEIDISKSTSEVFYSIPPKERVSIFSSFMIAINSLSLDERTLVISLFHDGLSRKDFKTVFGFEVNDKELNKVLQKLKDLLIDNLNTPFLEDLFNKNDNIFYFCLYRIYDEIPRELYNIAVDKDLSKDASLEKNGDFKDNGIFEQIEDEIIGDSTDSVSQVSSVKQDSISVKYNLFGVNKLLNSMEISNAAFYALELKRILNLSIKNKEKIIPHPMALYSSKLFSSNVLSAFNSQKELLWYFFLIKEKFDLNMDQLAHLYFLVAKSGYLDQHISFHDEIIIDIDSFGFKLKSVDHNNKIRKRLKKYLDILNKQYAAEGRTFSITFISQKLKPIMISRTLSVTAFHKYRQVLNVEGFKSFVTETVDDSFSNYFFNFLKQKNMNHMNLKVFSNDKKITESAKLIGAITASHEVSPYTAIEILSQIQPLKSPDFPILGSSETSVSSILKKYQLGYFSLSGFEFTSIDIVSVPSKPEQNSVLKKSA